MASKEELQSTQSISIYLLKHLSFNLSYWLLPIPSHANVQQSGAIWAGWQLAHLYSPML